MLRGAGPLRLLPAETSRGRTASTVRLTLTEPLARLHAALMDRLERFESGGGDEAAFFPDAFEPARRADVEWVRQFRTQAAHGRFDPHITLGVGPLPRPDSLRAAGRRARGALPPRPLLHLPPRARRVVLDSDRRVSHHRASASEARGEGLAGGLGRSPK